MKNLAKAFLAACMLFGASVSAWAQNTMFVTTKSGLILRDKPDKTGNKILTIPYGQAADVSEDVFSEVETIGEKTGYWRQVKYKGKLGFAFDAFLDANEPSDIKKTVAKDDFSAVRYSNAKAGLIIRTGAGRKNAKIITIPLGEACNVDIYQHYGVETINGVQGRWRKVKYKGKVGYAFDAYLVGIFNEADAQEADGEQ